MRLICVISLFSLIVISACNPIKQANRSAQGKVKIIYPTVAFDSLEAKRSIAYGKTNLEGVAYTKPKNVFGHKTFLATKRIFAANTTVVLIPMTDYVQNWYLLRQKYEWNKKRVHLNPDMGKYVLTATTDAYGRFRFEKLRPGKYFLQCMINYNTQHSRDVYTGSGYHYFGRTDYYERQYYNINHVNVSEAIAVISGEPSKIEVVVK